MVTLPEMGADLDLFQQCLLFPLSILQLGFVLVVFAQLLIQRVFEHMRLNLRPTLDPGGLDHDPSLNVISLRCVMSPLNGLCTEIAQVIKSFEELSQGPSTRLCFQVGRG